MAKLAQSSSVRNDVPHYSARPFLRWAGGKSYITASLLRFVPADVRERRYYEPFLGAASLFFALRHPQAILSDLNGHLIDCYREVRDNPEAVSKALGKHKSLDSEDYYYQVRDTYNRSGPGVARAARFIYLNRTGFNGVFRVNRKGAYNVPYGHKKTPRFPDEAELLRAASALQKAQLDASDYLRVLAKAASGDFVYLDPPYPPLNGTSYFTHYTADRFGTGDQELVAECVRSLDAAGCLVMISNADTPAIRDLYRGFHLNSLSVTRFVTTSSAKHRVKELIITNYERPRPDANGDLFEP